MSLLFQEVKHIYVDGGNCSENIDINFLLFPSITSIEFINYPPSLIRQITAHKYQLKRLTIKYSPAYCCSIYLDGNNDKSQWNKLEHLCLSNNGIKEMDASLKLIPFCRTIDLSNNLIPKIANLNSCIQLDTLNISHNCIQSVENLHILIGYIKDIDLSYNQLSVLKGFEKLYSINVLLLIY